MSEFTCERCKQTFRFHPRPGVQPPTYCCACALTALKAMGVQDFSPAGLAKFASGEEHL